MNMRLGKEEEIDTQDSGCLRQSCKDEVSRIGKNGRLWEKLLRRLVTLALVGWLVCNGLGIVDCQKVQPPEKTGALSSTQLDELKAFLKENNPEYTNFTYDQLNQWFEGQIPQNLKFEEFPRLYPFCVTADQINDTSRTNKNDHIHMFLNIFREMERVREKFYNFNASKHSTYFNDRWIEEVPRLLNINVQLTRINTPELDMVNLRQWLHITVSTKIKIKGLYMQSIVGPMGLPFGEFNLDFPCKDRLNETRDIDVVGQLTYCSYRPRTTIQHPSVYVAYDEKGRQKFHMNFFWTDITCMETPYLQFLMLVVRDFNYNETVNGSAKLYSHYEPLFSPIYLNTDFDSKSGAPFPYYPEWKDKMYCFLNNNTFNTTYPRDFPGYDDSINDPLNKIKDKWPSTKNGSDGYFEDLDWTLSTHAFRIQPNEPYDACITDRLRDMSQRDAERLECPPGPFRCDTSYGMGSRENVTAQRVKLVSIETNLSQCNPCGAPPCLELGFPEYKCDNLADELVIDINESNELNTIESIIRAKTHGLQAMFAFLVLVPLSNFMARFYKDVCGKCLCDNGPWIFVHIGTHIVSIVFMWLSIGPVMPRLSEINSQRKECKAKYGSDLEKYRDCLLLQSVANPHVPLALIAFMLQHFLIAFGFWRMKNAKARLILVALHSHFGYCCWIFGAISALVAGITKLKRQSDCYDLVVLSTLFLITPLMFTAAGVSLDCLTDRKVGIIPPRRQWPVLETVKLEGRGPYTLPKWIILGVYGGIMVFYWLLALGSGFTIIGSADKLFSGKKGTISSLFGKGCGGNKDWQDPKAHPVLRKKN